MIIMTLLLIAISISKAVSTSQAQSVRDTSAFINDISYFETTSTIKDIPRQSVYNWIKNWYIPNIVPKSVETPETLYVMADERYYLLHIFNTKPKSYFIDVVNTIILNNPKRKDIITKKLKYIINNYTNIKSMLALNIGSSMESHISHLIASFSLLNLKAFLLRE